MTKEQNEEIRAIILGAYPGVDDLSEHVDYMFSRARRDWRDIAVSEYASIALGPHDSVTVDVTDRIDLDRVEAAIGEIRKAAKVAALISEVLSSWRPRSPTPTIESKS